MDLKENEEVYHTFGGKTLVQLGHLHLQVQWVPIMGSLLLLPINVASVAFMLLPTC